MNKVVELVIEAMTEDARYGKDGHKFSKDGFGNYFLEETHEAVSDAWTEYQNIRAGRTTLEKLIADYAHAS